jgi:hypothetical protein
LGTAIIVEQQAALDKFALSVVQKLGRVGVIVQHPEGGDGDGDSKNTLEDKDPPLTVSRILTGIPTKHPARSGSDVEADLS